MVSTVICIMVILVMNVWLLEEEHVIPGSVGQEDNRHYFQKAMPE